MATARVPRLRSAIPSTDSFAMKNPTHCLLRNLPLRPRLLSTRCRMGTFHVAPQQLPARNFSTATRRLAGSTREPLEQQETGASAQKSEETLHRGHETTASIVDTTPGPQQSAAPPPTSSSTPTSTPTPTPRPRPSKPPTQPSSSDADFLATSRRITGTVIRTHTMSKTVAVATNLQYFDRFLQKHYTRASRTLVHDPHETLVAGDVIQYGLFPPSVRAERIAGGKGRNVRHVLRGVVTPFGVSLAARKRAKARAEAKARAGAGAGAAGRGGGGGVRKEKKKEKEREVLES